MLQGGIEPPFPSFPEEARRTNGELKRQVSSIQVGILFFILYEYFTYGTLENSVKVRVNRDA